jgi:hypothetical protein
MATDELDILADTTNEDTGLEDTTDYTEALTILANAPDTMGLGIQKQLNEDRPDPVVVGEDGQFYRNNAELTSEGWVSNIDYSEPVYYFTQPLEDDRYNNYGEASEDFSRNYSQGNYYTKDEIKQFWDGDKGTGMDLFKEQNPNLDFDTYFNFVQESSSLYTGNINATYADNQEAVDALATKYGIATTYTDDDGQVWGFNGSGLSQTRFVDTSIDFGGIIMSVAAGAMTGGVLAGPLTSALGSVGITGSAATAAVQGISSAASQLITSGEVDLKQALISAAIGYGGDKLGNALEASKEVDGVIGEISNTVSSTVDTLKTLTETNMPIVDAAIKAGGMSLLTQLVSTGDIDLKEAAVAAVIGGGIEAFNQFNTNMDKLGVPKDEYMADLAEYEEFQQAAIDADIKDPFLNPNYTTVGDGLMVNAAGNVFNYDGDNLGNMSTLDTNNDGMLSGTDLQQIEVTATKVDDPFMGYALGDNVIVTADGTTLPKDSVLVATRDGGYYSYDAEGNKVDVTLQPYNEVFGGSKGDLVWTSEGGTDGYISYENGELAYKKVEGQWVDAQGNVVNDPQTVDELTMVAAKAIDEPLESVEYFDQSGNPITYKYPPAGLQDNFEQGEFKGLIFGPNGEISEVWYDPVTNTEYVKAQGTTQITAIRTPDTPPEPVDPTKVTEVTEVTKTTTSGGQEVANNTADAIATATNTNQINETIAAASQQGASASQLANAINAAVAAGTISAEQAAAALGAIDVTASVDRSTTSISTGAGGMLTGGAGDIDTGTTATGTTDTGTETSDTGVETAGTGTGTGTDTGDTDTGDTDTGTGTGDTDTSTGKGTETSINNTIIGALGGAITTVAGTGDPGTGDPGTGDPGTGGPGTGGPPGIDGKDGKDGRDGVSSRPFTPYEFKGLSYQTPTIQEIVQNPNIDYSAPLDRIINQGMFGKYI